MKSLFAVFALGFAVAATWADEPATRTVTTGVLLDEMKDLEDAGPLAQAGLPQCPIFELRPPLDHARSAGLVLEC